MLRNSLAVLLIGSWIGLSGVDLVEEWDLPTQVSAPKFGGESLPGINLANDLLESGEITQFHQLTVFELCGVSSSIDGLAVDKKAGKIHKLIRVFLI